MKHINSSGSTSLLTMVDPADIQPNAVDLKVKKIMNIPNGCFGIYKDSKQHRDWPRITGYEEPHQKNPPLRDGVYSLIPGSYEVLFENEIEVGEGEAGWVITRSTLVRNGLFLTSGLYDSGYKGVMAGVLHVTSGHAKIEIGARLGQFLLFDSEMVHKYAGDYGSGTQHDEKYK